MDHAEHESRVLLQQIRSRISTFLTPEVRMGSIATEPNPFHQRLTNPAHLLGADARKFASAARLADGPPTDAGTLRLIASRERAAKGGS